jgi:hypothetical protein
MLVVRNGGNDMRDRLTLIYTVLCIWENWANKQL